MIQDLNKASEQKFKKALEFATEKHEGQTRRGGLAYITHPIAVAELVREWGCDSDTQIAALFHDLLEDTDATEAEIEALGGKAVLQAVKCLTKTKGYNMENYINEIRENPMAFVIKGADRLHNLRSAVCAEDSFKRRYIAESKQWYMDFHEDIPKAVEALEESRG